MVRGFLGRLFAGRYGFDQLNAFLLILYLVLIIVERIIGLPVFYWIALVFILISLLRSMSRDMDRRRAENQKFLQILQPIRRFFRDTRTRMKDRNHRYFRCPCCGQQMRVPRGKGRITVHCRSCGATFEEKS